MESAGQSGSPVVFTDADAIRILLSGSQAEFPRPPAGINRVVTGLSKHLPRRDLSREDLHGWLANSLDVFSHLVKMPETLDRIERETAWAISADDPPDPDVWSGECKFADGGLPVVICYSETMASRLPGPAFDLAWQGAMDHFVGHLYPYFQGAEDPNDYNENVACRYQHLAAQHRARDDRRFRVIAALLPWVYRLHKRIPLSNYETLPA